MQRLWAQCCFVYSVTGETAILPLQKRHLVAKNEFAFSFRPTWKSTDSFTQLGLGIRLKTTRFNDLESTFFWETITLFMVDFQI